MAAILVVNQSRIHLFTDIHTVGAARMKRAAGRLVDGTRHFTLQHDALFLLMYLRHRDRGKQRLRNKGACENKPVRLQV